MGFFELKASSLPSVPWQEYMGTEVLSDDKLWTIRTAVYEGKDIGLPRYVGISGSEATIKIKELYKKYKGIGMIVYYPFFVAVKSGTLSIEKNRVVIEAVTGNLWHLVNESKIDVTLMKDNNKDWVKKGNAQFLSEDEIEAIEKYVAGIRSKYRDEMIEGKTILLEWSFAFDGDIAGQPLGDVYLIFYEIRSI